MTISGPLKYHGGKSYLAKRIVALMPPRCKNPNAPSPDDPGWLHYVEPYFGGGAVLLENNPEGISEVANDMNGHLFRFWNVLRTPDAFAEFIRVVHATPFSEEHWKCAAKAMELSPPENEQEWIWEAVNFFIWCRQSLAGRMDSFAGITRSRTRRGMNEQVSAWLNCIEGLPAVHARLKRVLILNRPALEVIQKEDGPRTLVYADPPYLHETRSTTGEYEHEMTTEQHSALLDLLATIEGRFMLSGYHSEMYDETAITHGWKCHEFDLPNNSAGGKEKERRVECVWTNF